MPAGSRWRLGVTLALSLAACSRQPTAPAPSGNGSSTSQTRSLHGIVRDAILESRAPIPGAAIEVTTTAGVKLSTTTTAADGSFHVPGLPVVTEVRLVTSHDGFETSTQQVGLISNDTASDVSLTPVFVDVSGLVTGAPPALMPVGAAVIRIISGTEAGYAIASGASGEFVLPHVWGEFDIAIDRAGYERATAHVVAVRGAHVTVRLTPKPSRAYVEFTGGLCTSVQRPSWLTCSAPFERTHSIDVPRAGTISLTVDYSYVGDYYYNSLTLDIRCGSRVVAQKTLLKLWDPPAFVMPDNIRGTFEIAVPEACTYDLRLWNFIADTKGGIQTDYRIGVDFPR